MDSSILGCDGKLEDRTHLSCGCQEVQTRGTPANLKAGLPVEHRTMATIGGGTADTHAVLKGVMVERHDAGLQLSAFSDGGSNLNVAGNCTSLLTCLPAAKHACLTAVSLAYLLRYVLRGSPSHTLSRWAALLLVDLPPLRFPSLLAALLVSCLRACLVTVWLSTLACLFTCWNACLAALTSTSTPYAV